MPGSPGEQGRDFNAALSGLDQFISAHGRTTVAFRVIDLEHSFPPQEATQPPARGPPGKSRPPTGNSTC
jgi:hypothetical protein